jgi:PEP-CTERM motif
MFSRSYIAAAAIAVAVGASSPAAATIIYDNGGPNRDATDEVTEWVQAEDFSVASATTLAGAHFWTVEYGAWDGTLTWYVFADNGGLPGSALATGNGINVVKTATGNTVFGGPQYEYSFDFDNPLALTGGTAYWFGLHLSSDFDLDRIGWQLTLPGLGTYGAHSHLGTFDNWIGNGGQHAFYLTDTSTAVPEPSTFVMLGATLLGLGAARLRRKKT